MKKLMVTILAFTLIISVFAILPVFSVDEGITVYIDGEKIEFDVNPQIVDGRTLVPLRKIFEEIGALVKWDGETQTITARKSSKTVTLKVDSKELIIDKGKTDDDGNPITENITLEVPPQIIEGRTLVPARAISESFGLEVSWNGEERKVLLASKENDDTWKDNAGSINLTRLTTVGDGIEINGKNIVITKGGDYAVSGTLENGSITVDTKERVKLRLNGVSVTAEEGPCIFFKDTDKAFITISKDSENYLLAKNSEDGAIYSKENLEIKGKGKLILESLNGHGLKASDNLTIEEGTIVVNAVSDGLHINETFKMTGGELDIVSTGDGIDSESIVIIEGGKIDIETKGGPVSGTQTETEGNRRFPMQESAKVEFSESSKGINAEWMMSIKGGEFNIKSAYHALHCTDEIVIDGGKFNLYSEYGKGISAHGNLTISGEDTVVDIVKSTEGIESKNVLTINNGTYAIRSSDDAINATGGSGGMTMGQKPGNKTVENTGETVNPGTRFNKDETNLNGGQLNQRPGRMEGSPFGGERFAPPEGETVAPPEGEAVTPPEREMPGNAGVRWIMPGGMSGGMPGGMGRNSKDCLIINGGTFDILGGDDCIDANGNLSINGGVIKATYPSGSFTGNFGVLDADGQTKIGENVTLLFATGSGNEKSLNTAQNVIIVYLPETRHAEEKIIVSDKGGESILEYTTTGKFGTLLICSDALNSGETYIVNIGEEKYETELSEKISVIGTAKTGNNGFGIPRGRF